MASSTAACARRRCIRLPKQVHPDFANPPTIWRSQSFRLVFLTLSRLPAFPDSPLTPRSIMAAHALKPSRSAHGETSASRHFHQKRAQPPKISQPVAHGWRTASISAAKQNPLMTNSKRSSPASQAWRSKSGAQTVLRGLARPHFAKLAPCEKAYWSSQKPHPKPIDPQERGLASTLGPTGSADTLSASPSPLPSAPLTSPEPIRD